jgi:hypothetical protein
MKKRAFERGIWGFYIAPRSQIRKALFVFFHSIMPAPAQHKPMLNLAIIDSLKLACKYLLMFKVARVYDYRRSNLKAKNAGKFFPIRLFLTLTTNTDWSRCWLYIQKLLIAVDFVIFALKRFSFCCLIIYKTIFLVIDWFLVDIYWNLGTKKSLVTETLRWRSSSPTPLRGYTEDAGSLPDSLGTKCRRPLVDSYLRSS